MQYSKIRASSTALIDKVNNFVFNFRSPYHSSLVRGSKSRYICSTTLLMYRCRLSEHNRLRNVAVLHQIFRCNCMDYKIIKQVQIAWWQDFWSTFRWHIVILHASRCNSEKLRFQGRIVHMLRESMITYTFKDPAASMQPFAVTIPIVICVFNAKHKYNQLHRSQKLDFARSWHWCLHQTESRVINACAFDGS